MGAEAEADADADADMVAEAEVEVDMEAEEQVETEWQPNHTWGFEHWQKQKLSHEQKPRWKRRQKVEAGVKTYAEAKAEP